MLRKFAGRLLGFLIALALGFLCHKEMDEGDGWLELGAIVMVFGIILWTVPFIVANHRHPSKPYGTAFILGFVGWWAAAGFGLITVSYR